MLTLRVYQQKRSAGRDDIYLPCERRCNSPVCLGANSIKSKLIRMDYILNIWGIYVTPGQGHVESWCIMDRGDEGGGVWTPDGMGARADCWWGGCPVCGGFFFLFAGILNVCWLRLPASVDTHLCNVRSAAAAISALNSFNQKKKKKSRNTHTIQRGRGRRCWVGERRKNSGNKERIRLLCPSTLMHRCSSILGALPSLLGERNTGITLVDYTGGGTGAGAGRPQPGPAVIMFK